MNKKDNAKCFPKDDEYDTGKYDVTPDEDGKNPLTGSPIHGLKGNRWFTCVALEVFALE